MSNRPTKAQRSQRLVGEAAQLLESRRPGEAAAKLLEARELDPQDVATAINLGGAYILQHKYAAAVPVLEAAAQLEPGNIMVWTNLAAAYLGNLRTATPERQDKAIQAYERALSIDPATPHAHYNLGLIYLERADSAQAIAHFAAALETDPADRDARSYLDRLQRGELGRPRA